MSKNSMMHLALIVTYNCNMQCEYCFEKGHESEGTMTVGLIPYIEKVIDHYNKNKEVVLELYGGEPLLTSNKNFINAIMEMSKNKNINKIGILTNGYSLLEFAPIFDKYKDINFSVQVTIDGTEEVHNQRRPIYGGSYNRIIKGIEDCLKLANVNIVVRTNVDRDNIHVLSELYLAFEDRFSYYRNFKCYLVPVKGFSLTNIISETELIRKMEDIPSIPNWEKIGGIHLLSYPYTLIDNNINAGPKTSYCETVNGEYIALSPDGLIYPCSETVGLKKFSIGSYIPQLNINNEKHLSWLKNNILDDSQCNNCSIRLLCGGGCAYEKMQYINTKEYCEKIYKDLDSYFEYLKERHAYE